MKKKYPTTPTPIASPKRQPQERAPGRQNVTTYHVRDPQGNVLAVYEHKHGESGNGTFTLTPCFKPNCLVPEKAISLFS